MPDLARSASMREMQPLILSLPGNHALASALAAALPAELGALSLRRFPDGECYVRIDSPVKGREVLLVCTLDRPDDKLLPLVFAAATVRELAAARIGLLAPYLAYMRQDRRFRAGEGITSAYFAKLLSSALDWIVTVDPHLHRRTSLTEIYSIPTTVLHAAPYLSAWIAERVRHPVIIGPDAESAQWVAAVAGQAGAPSVVLQKTRRGDREVELRLPDLERWRDHTPVLVDDIISTARTMIEATRQLRAAGFAPSICLAVHAVLVERAYQDLLAAGAQAVITCNTIPHSSNDIDLTQLIAAGVADQLQAPRERPPTTLTFPSP